MLFGRGALLVLGYLALLSACVDTPAHNLERDAEASPVSERCTPRECGPRPAAPNVVCADGTLAGPGVCQRLESGQCGYPSHACVEPDAGVDASQADAADVDANKDAEVDAFVPNCGARGKPDCAAGQFCDLGVDTMCGALGLGGSCQDIPSLCVEDFDPVCACDNRSYDNACAAHTLGLSVLRRGLCTSDECLAAGGQPTIGIGPAAPVCAEGDESWRIGRAIEPVLCCLSKPVPGATCGGLGGNKCQAGLFCNREQAAGGTGCGVIDGTGVCDLRPDSCHDDYQPVCGCDHRTYTNSCAAHAVSVSVLHDGSCNERDCAFIGGRPVNGTGAGPMCAKDEEDHGRIVYTSGQISIEGTICCIPL